MRNIVMMFRRDIAGRIYDQMMKHFYCRNGFLVEEIIGVRRYNLEPTYSVTTRLNLHDNYSGDIRSIVFDGIRKGVFDRARFDSDPELRLARNLETDESVLNWLRPAPNEFNIVYNRGQRYQPDFVIETEDVIYLTEVKRADKMTDPDVVAKKERGTQYCSIASRWSKANGYKEWRYLFIPDNQVQPNSTFPQLAARYADADS